jgi:integrase
MRLTEKFLQGVKVTSRRDLTVTGRRGMLLRLSPNRGRTAKTFRFRYARAGIKDCVTLGEYPALTLADAHELHARCETAVKSGGDPEALVRAYWAQRAPRAKDADAGGPTVADVVKEFLAVAERQRRRPEQARYLLEANVLPKLGTTPVAGLRKRDLVEMLDRIAARAPVLANRVQALLKQAFAVAADRDLIEAAPTFPRAPAGGHEGVRTRVLTDPEIKTLWEGLDKLSAGDDPKILRPLALALKLQLVTAQRRGEIAAARWDHVVGGTWCIPTSPKKGRAGEHIPHFVPLSPLAQKLLKELRQLADGSDYWLPSQRTQKLASDRARSISKAARETRKELKMKDWRPHDLRRTARTHLAKLGVAEVVAERVLGHGHEDRMVATYDQHAYRDEMKTALKVWASALERIVAAREEQ